MSRFGPDPKAFFENVYQDTPPWDVGGAQPDMAALLKAFPPAGPVLDAGCGSGDLAFHIARLGVPVLGIDFVEAAIRHAREKADALPPEVKQHLEFRVADALAPSRLGRQFGAVVDSGFFHLFAPEGGDALIAEYAHVLKPGGRLYLHAFATEFPIPNAPRAVTEEEVRSRFVSAKGWKMLTVKPALFQSRVSPVPATIACIERIA